MLEARHRVFAPPELERNWSTREIRRFAALASDAARAAPFDLRQLWYPLCAGQLRVVDAFFTSENCWLIVCPRRGRALTSRRRKILEGLLLGKRPKVLALELRLSPSSISGALAHCMKAFGLADGTAGLPLVLLMAGRAALVQKRFEAQTSSLPSDEGELTVVSVPRPDLRLRALLSNAEFDVVGKVLEGRTYEGISEIRGSSARTIANQLASAYRKLGLSGRLELMHEMAKRAEL